MARQVKFAFAYGVESEGLAFRLGALVFMHRSHGAADGELAQFLSRDVADQALVVEPVSPEEGPTDQGPIVFLVRRRSPAEA